MQRIIANGKPLSAQKRTLDVTVRAFASSPQPNPFDKSVKKSLDHDGKKHNYYKLPALGDSRICKWLFLRFWIQLVLTRPAFFVCSQPPFLTPSASSWKALSATATTSA